MAEWSKARAWKVRVLQKGTKGSNPFLSAIKTGSNHAGFNLLTGLFYL